MVPLPLLSPKDSTTLQGCQYPVRLYPELSAAAFQTSQDKPLALWHCLRSLNSSGSGILDYHRAILTLSGYGYSPGTARRHLRQGNGQFWTIENTEDGSSRIAIKSLLAVCQHLRVSRLGWPVDVAQSTFCGLRKRRAAMYASWLAHRGKAPISRQTITVATGLGRRRQQRYDKAAGILRVPNYASQEINGRLVPIMDLVEGKARSWWTPMQLPSTFIPDVLRAPSGMIRKVNAQLRWCSIRADATTSLERRYFETGSQAAHAKNRAPLAYVRARTQPLVRGQAWTLV